MTTTCWQYLEKSSHASYQQLQIKGRKMRASIVWFDMIANQMTPEEVAVSKDLPLGAVYEAIEYCEANQVLIQQDAENERRYLEQQGVSLEPKVIEGKLEPCLNM